MSLNLTVNNLNSYLKEEIDYHLKTMENLIPAKTQEEQATFYFHKGQVIAYQNLWFKLIEPLNNPPKGV